MKKKKLLVILSLAGFVVIAAKPFMPDGKAGYTSSPGEDNCSTSCHSPASTGSVTITSDSLNGKYQPGKTYHITVTVSEANADIFGLGVEALKNSDSTNAGTFVITNAAETQLMLSETGNGRQNVVHKLDGGHTTSASKGSKAFTFDWTAPSTDVKDITFYVSSVAGIQGSGDMADKHTYVKSQIINSPTTTVGIDKLVSASVFLVYPNPVRDVINISFNNSGNEKVKTTLYSINGQKVADLFNENMPNGIVEKHIPVSDKWAQGTYFMQVEQGGKSSVQKIEIQ